MQKLIALVFSGVVQKYDGINLLLNFHNSSIVNVFRDQYRQAQPRAPTSIWGSGGYISR